MAIRIYRGGAVGLAAPGAQFIAGWLKAASPGNRMILKRVMISFQSYATASNLRNPQFIDRENYCACILDNDGLPHPFRDMNNNFTGGTPYFSCGHQFDMPGVYEVNYEYQDEIWMLVFSYNRSAVQHHHALDVIFTVEETPLNQ